MLARVLVGILCLCVLEGCTKLPDLDAPCREFGKYCAQLPINVEPLHNLGDKS